MEDASTIPQIPQNVTVRLVGKDSFVTGQMEVKLQLKKY